jgi:uncharacterized protein (TIGR02246 family)
MNEIEKQIKQVFDLYKDAVFAKNVEAFVSLYDDDIHVFDMWGKWSYEGIKAWRGMVTEWFGSLNDEKVLVSFDDLQITVSPDIAIAHTFVTFKGLSADGTELRSMNNRLTCALKNANGTWKIIHEHSSSPLDPETTKALFQRK